jgi:hypothetical protein
MINNDFRLYKSAKRGGSPMTNAKDTTFDLAVLFGHPVIFADIRIDPDTLPSGLHAYELRHSDDDWSQPATLENHVAVNFFGTVISQNEIPVEDFLQVNDGDFKVDPNGSVTLNEYFSGDYELTPPPEADIRVVIVEPLKPPREAVIPNKLDAFQSTVEGYIKTYSPFPDNVVLILNEEGKVNGLTPNRAIWDEQTHQVQDILFGTFFVAGLDQRNSRFASLSPEQVKTYMRKFKDVEIYKTSGERGNLGSERMEVSL